MQESKNARTSEELSGVTLLGNNKTKYSYDYTPEVLETFVNKHMGNDYVVTFDYETHSISFFSPFIKTSPLSNLLFLTMSILFIGTLNNIIVKYKY